VVGSAQAKKRAEYGKNACDERLTQRSPWLKPTGSIFQRLHCEA
jgi:hypothetical protein